RSGPVRRRGCRPGSWSVSSASSRSRGRRPRVWPPCSTATWRLRRAHPSPRRAGPGRGRRGALYGGDSSFEIRPDRGGTMFGYHIGVDIGGTFTDAVAIDEGGRLFRAKAPTTPADYTAGILAALGSLAEEAGTPLDELLGST